MGALLRFVFVQKLKKEVILSECALIRAGKDWLMK